MLYRADVERRKTESHCQFYNPKINLTNFAIWGLLPGGVLSIVSKQTLNRDGLVTPIEFSRG